MARFATKLRRRQLDSQLAQYRNLSRLPRGYIREIRDALEMSSYQLAQRLGVSQSSVMEMEENERTGSISLKTLERAAAALGCKVVYGFIPEVDLEQQMLAQAQRQAIILSQSVLQTMGLECQSTDKTEQQHLIDQLTEDLLHKGGREIWKSHD